MLNDIRKCTTSVSESRVIFHTNYKMMNVSLIRELYHYDIVKIKTIVNLWG